FSLDEELAQKLYAEELAKEIARQEQEKYNLEKALELQRLLDKREKDVDKGYTPGSDKGRLKLEELIDLCTTLSNRVSTLENELSSTKAFYHKAFITLTKKLKKLETQLKQKRSRAIIHSSNKEEKSVHIEDSPKQERMIEELDKDEDVNLSYFKGIKYEDIRPIFERVCDQVHTFVPKDLEIEKVVMNRSGFHLQQESSKKQKLD
nr:hypothetical protein [Tanacetum cinerariifolium]